MRALLQRVSSAMVTVGDEVVGQVSGVDAEFSSVTTSPTDSGTRVRLGIDGITEEELLSSLDDVFSVAITAYDSSFGQVARLDASTCEKVELRGGRGDGTSWRLVVDCEPLSAE